MTHCIFCKIAQKQLNTTFIYEDNEVLAFDDIHPKAPIHILIIPKKHIATLNDIGSDDTMLLGQLLQTAKTIAAQKNIDQSGYRIIMNCNKEGGQEVYHIHLHLIGGRRLGFE